MASSPKTPASKPQFGFERRIFRTTLGICTTICIAGFISGVFQGKPIPTLISVMVGVLFYIGSFTYTTYKEGFRALVMPFILFTQLFVSLQWFNFDGLGGSMSLGVIMTWVISCVIASRKQLKWISLSYVLNIIALCILEESFPHWVVDTDPDILTINKWIFFLLFGLGVAAAVVALKKNYSQERVATNKKNQELNKFAYVVAHDLKAPLRAISSISSWVLEDNEGKLDEETEENLEKLKSRVNRMDNLITGILEYSRIERLVFQKDWVDVHNELSQVIETLQIETNLELKVRGKMPRIWANPAQVQQIFQNLLGNAIKYHDSKEGKVEVSHSEKGRFHHFAVKDDGPGIDPKFHDKIFALFQTLEAKDIRESTGIGLSIVKKIIEENGGEVNLNSQKGKGATFSFTWPKGSGF